MALKKVFLDDMKGINGLYRSETGSRSNKTKGEKRENKTSVNPFGGDSLKSTEDEGMNKLSERNATDDGRDVFCVGC